MLSIGANEPLAITVIQAIHSGDVDGLNRLLSGNPGLVTARINERTLLLLVADWPGHFPKGAETVKALIAAGSDPNATAIGRCPETPLHWAASSDDVEVLDALIDGGADIEISGASIAGGTPLEDAVGYGQWRAARRLVSAVHEWKSYGTRPPWVSCRWSKSTSPARRIPRPMVSTTLSGKPAMVDSAPPRNICSPVARN